MQLSRARVGLALAVFSLLLFCLLLLLLDLVPQNTVGVALMARARALTSWTDQRAPWSADPVATAWERAREAGSYRFAADIVQTAMPVTSVTNVGRQSRQDAVRVEGETDLQARQMRFTLWSQGGSVLDATGGVEVRVDGDRAMARRPGGAWEETDDLAGAFAPQGDFLAYAAAAKDVQAQGSEQRGGITFTRYTFRVDGPSFAAYLRAKMEQQLRAEGELPPGVSLELPRLYVGMAGSGELWIDTQGLPLRQVLHLQFPPSEEREIRAEITVDFSDFGNLAPVAAGGQWPWSDLGAVADGAVRLMALLAVCALALLVVRYRGSRQVYTALSLALIAILLFAPLIQNTQAAGFSVRQEAR